MMKSKSKLRLYREQSMPKYTFVYLVPMRGWLGLDEVETFG
jgi:hypothetical protein